MTKEIVATLEQLPKVAKDIVEILPRDSVIFLRGNLAAGKTTLVKALADVKGNSDAVTSPTFSIQQIYGDSIYHYDLYQCTNEKFMQLGLLDELENSGWHLIEWGDDELYKILKSLGFEVTIIEITTTNGARNYRIITDA
jgi:tRNA threonylcarbamoyladenosine biosynthesis protein TsaE